MSLRDQWASAVLSDYFTVMGTTTYVSSPFSLGISHLLASRTSKTVKLTFHVRTHWLGPHDIQASFIIISLLLDTWSIWTGLKPTRILVRVLIAAVSPVDTNSRQISLQQLSSSPWYPSQCSYSCSSNEWPQNGQTRAVCKVAWRGDDISAGTDQRASRRSLTNGICWEVNGVKESKVSLLLCAVLVA